MKKTKTRKTSKCPQDFFSHPWSSDNNLHSDLHVCRHPCYHDVCTIRLAALQVYFVPRICYSVVDTKRTGFVATVPFRTYFVVVVISEVDFVNHLIDCYYRLYWHIHVYYSGIILYT